jgi:toxin ParE1/3/4
MTFSVVFSPEAQEQLVALYQYISEQGAPINAERYTNAIIAFAVNDKNETVSIVGIYYGGQDFESMLVQDQ